MTLVATMLFGLAFGSFANAAIDRLARRVSLTGRSRCDGCARTLALVELVPLLSYIALRGVCRTCRSPIGLRSPLVEASAGVGFAAVFVALPPGPAAFACASLLALAIAAGVAATRKLPSI